MAKVLRIHKGASNTINNWEDSTIIGTIAINTIEDPVGATDQLEITSIPSPFARLDLAKRALKYVADHELDGNTAYHKIVSDCLDVGQIFFNIEKYRNSIEIIVWDKNTQIQELLESSEEHARLGKTYETYMQQDGDEYHFKSMNRIYLLNYLEGDNTMNIIGATSPATLFFTSANNLEYVGKKIKFGTDSPFDSDYKPLYKREDNEYIKYWYSLKNSRADFAILFPEVDAYLEKCYAKLNADIKKEILNTINDIPTHYANNYDEIPVVASEQQYVSVLNQKLRTKRCLTNFSSDFEMVVTHRDKVINNQVPLALPVETYTEPSLYVTANWDNNTKVPYFDKLPINSRTLPDDGTPYPYVTVSDFLEDSIVCVKYKLNSSAYFSGNDDGVSEKDSYLLPIKKSFFDYFDVEKLKGTVNGKKIFEIQRLATRTGVKAILRVPIRVGYIQYERVYVNSGRGADRENNKGAIIEREFTIGQYPSLRYPNNVTPYYRVAILDRDSVVGSNNPYNLAFYNANNDAVEIEGVVNRNCNNGDRIDRYLIDTKVYSLEKNYEYIHISDSENLSCIVIPTFASKNGGKIFRFAIDFGTTSTHIEYSINGGASRAFDITDSDQQIQKLHISDDGDLRKVFNSDFIPDTIGGDSIFKYPMRTVISEGLNTNWSKPIRSMADTNIPFTYEKMMPLEYNELHTDLKWSANDYDKLRAHQYIDILLIMLRNKVLLNNGDLAQTEIVWFYPASMTQARFNAFKAEWEGSYKKLFNAPAKKMITISESVAPYYYHKATNGAVSTVASIDIGGGTTDVLIVKDGIPLYLTSFRYAANTLFGDGYSYNADTNGVIKEYTPKIIKKLEANNFHALKDILNSLVCKKVSSDIIAFYYSLAYNKEVLKEKVEISFEKMVADDKRAKYIVILFYVSIIYHIAQIMKAKQLDMPRHITFSGNGSKILNILTTSNPTLVNFTKFIFEKVYCCNYSEDGLDIIRPDDSKETTCKGGVLTSPFITQDYSEIKDMKTMLLGTDSSTFVPQKMEYNNITSKIKESIINNCKEFIDFTFDLDKEFSFYDAFDVDKSISNDVRNLCKRDIKVYLENGIKLKESLIKEDGADNNIEETLFFYPLKGVLNTLVREIYNIQ